MTRALHQWYQLVPLYQSTTIARARTNLASNRRHKQNNPRHITKASIQALTSLVPIGTSVPKANPAYNYTMQATKNARIYWPIQGPHDQDKGKDITIKAKVSNVG
jgi:hypothetical protein